MLGLLFKEDLVLPDGDDASRCDALVKHNGDLKALLKTSTQEITTRDGATFEFFFSFPFFFFEFEFESASAWSFRETRQPQRTAHYLSKAVASFHETTRWAISAKPFFYFFYLKKSFHRSSHESPRGKQQLHTLRRHRCHSGQGWVTVKIERWISFSHNLFSCFSSCFLFSFFLSIIQQLLNSLESRSSRRRDPLTTSLWKSQLWRISLARRWEGQ